MSEPPQRPLVDVAIALVFRGPKLLVTRRLAQAHLGGLWEFPGGKIEPGETAEAAAERELLEEVGLRARARRRGAVIEHSYPTRSVRLYPVYCTSESGELELRGVADARWVEARELPSLSFPDANRSLLEELARTTWPGL